MLLRIQISKLVMPSQIFSGLDLRVSIVPAVMFGLGLLFWLLGNATDNSKNTLLPIHEANASISLEDGAFINFSNGQRRHIRNAVASDPKNLLKLHGLSVIAAFDKPEIIRKDLPAVVWQYRHKGCVLDIYFKTKDDKAELAPVVHYEMRSRSSDAPQNAPDEKECLRDMISNGAETQMVGVSAFYKSYIQ